MVAIARRDFRRNAPSLAAGSVLAGSEVLNSQARFWRRPWTAMAQFVGKSYLTSANGNGFIRLYRVGIGRLPPVKTSFVQCQEKLARLDLRPEQAWSLIR
jgi:hypothetical protein